MRALAIDRPAVVDWYLRNRARSRAIFDLIDREQGHDAARAMLVYAFAAEVIGRVAVAPVRRRLHGLLAGRLPGAPQELFS